LFIPTTIDDVRQRGWNALDVIIVTGDTYIDSPFSGAAIIGHLLIKNGFRTGIIAQPDTSSSADIGRLGEPSLFWGVTSGAVDSMISNYTSSGKKRNKDDLTPGGANNRRPDRALIAYTNLIRRYHKNTAPVVLGGIEASLRRVAHYDAWDDRVRRSVLFDAKADLILYGMAENSVLALARAIRSGTDHTSIPGICYAVKSQPDGLIELPSFEEVSADKKTFAAMFMAFLKNSESASSKGMFQKHGDRYLIHNPPSPPLAPDELDAVYTLPFERKVHPFYAAMGRVRATETTAFSITTHRGCFGGCSFCSISIHQGRKVTSRSRASIIKEARALTAHPDFKGIIPDLGGPTANMYGMGCAARKDGYCGNRDCLYPSPCPSLNACHKKLIDLLDEIKNIPGIKKVFIASGVRHDLILRDETHGEACLEKIIASHISGQLKIAPEHSEKKILSLMKKPGPEILLRFKKLFETLNRKHGKKQYLTYYFIAAHPGCGERDMLSLEKFIERNLHLVPEQVQIFTPSPSTLSTLMYYTGKDPFTGETLFVEKNAAKKARQKNIITQTHKKRTGR